MAARPPFSIRGCPAISYQGFLLQTPPSEPSSAASALEPPPQVLQQCSEEERKQLEGQPLEGSIEYLHGIDAHTRWCDAVFYEPPMDYPLMPHDTLRCRILDPKIFMSEQAGYRQAKHTEIEALYAAPPDSYLQGWLGLVEHDQMVDSPGNIPRANAEALLRQNVQSDACHPDKNCIEPPAEPTKGQQDDGHHNVTTNSADAVLAEPNTTEPQTAGSALKTEMAQNRESEDDGWVDCFTESVQEVTMGEENQKSKGTLKSVPRISLLSQGLAAFKALNR